MKLSSIVVSVAVIISACNHTGLNEKQREQLKEGKVNRAIRKISDAQIVEATLAKGEYLVNHLPYAKDTSATYFIAQWVYDSIEIEDNSFSRIQDAYLYEENGELPSSAYVELFHKDSVLFVKPSFFDQKRGLWFIVFDKKEIVRTIK